MKKSKLIAVVITVLAMLIILPVAASAVESDFTGWNHVQDGGYYEYYNYGNKYTDGEYWIEGNYFRFDAEGKMLNAQWYRNPENLEYYYYEAGGYRATEEILWVDGAYYYFNESGVMADNGEFSVYDYVADRWTYVRAKAGGALYRNEWYQDAEGEWYYYGDNGCAARGVTYVGSVPYYFGYRGRMYYDSNFSVSEGGPESESKTYRARENGILYCNEWYETEWGDWYYYHADCSQAKGYTLVGSTYYFFTESGWMVTDQTRYDEATGLSYYCDKNGITVALNANGWTLVGKDYFYCVDGVAAKNEIRLIGNAYYYFNWQGVMADDEEYSFYIEDDWYYIRAKAGGALYCGEWYLNNEAYYDSGVWEYYGYDCNKFTDTGIHNIGGYDYYFMDGHAMSDYLYDDESGVYVAGDNCVLTKCSDGWLNFHNDWYYVLNGQLVRDEMIQIGGAKYGFNYEGEMYYDTYFDLFDEETSDWTYYLTGKSGAIIETPGWTTQNGRFFYVNEDGTLYTGELDVNGTKYFLYPEMNYATMDYVYEWDEANETDACYLYIVMPDGSYQKVTADGYYTTPYGKLLVENGQIFNGWKQNADGTWSYFWPEMAAGQSVYIDDAYYHFDEAGKLLANGWIAHNNSYMFADAYGALADGIANIGGVNYLFINHTLAYNTHDYFDGDIYVTDANGIAYKLDEGEGWKQVNGNWYYIAGDQLVTGYHYIIEGEQEVCYFFDYESGRMMTDCYNGSYYFDEYGRRYEGWKWVNNGWKYFNPNECWHGKYYIDDKFYFFKMGYMLSSTTYFDSYEGKAFVIDAYGIVVDEYALPDGMIYQNGGACLIQNGERYDGWYGEYYFDDGYMVIDRVERVGDNWYYLDNHGKYVRGWYQDFEGDWIYADAYGALCYNEWLQLGNSWYYFEGAWMLKDGIYYIENEDTRAEFDASGRFIGYVEDDAYELPTSNANTWEYKDGNWYYYNATGTLEIGSRLYIGNAWYRFDYDGKMITNTYDYDGYYYTASGAMLQASCEWAVVDGKWVYFGANGNVEAGWINLNGVRYYIYADIEYDENTDEEYIVVEMVTGYQLINNKVYYFDASGACQGEYVGEGWLQLNDGDFVYFHNGELLTEGLYNINGTGYYFLYSSRMAKGDWYYVESIDKYVHVSESGAVLGAGWHNTADGWAYVDANEGAYVNGVYYINGGLYFFDNGYWVP